MSDKSHKAKLNWKQRIVRDLERVEKLLPEPAFMQGDWPEWTRLMAMELTKAAFPGVSLGNWENLSAIEVGRLVGGKQACLAELEKYELSEKEEAAVEEVLRKKWGDKAEERFMEELTFYEEKFTPAYRGAIRKAINLACAQPEHEQAAFFKGYADTVGQSPNLRMNTLMKTYFLMVLRWRDFEWLAQSGRYSARQLHDLLCKLFGAHLVGDLKTTEKMCERKGLHFRKRGRPALPGKSDSEAA